MCKSIIKPPSKPNPYRGKVPAVLSVLGLGTESLYLQGYPDTRLLRYLKFGFPLSLRKPHKLAISEVKNHFSTVSHKQAVQEYLDKKILAGAILEPFNISWTMVFIFHIFLLDLMTSINVGSSWIYHTPKGLRFMTKLTVTFRLKFPSIGNIVKEIVTIGEGIILAKMDISRAFRNLRVDTGDALNFGILCQGCQYLVEAVVFGRVHGSCTFQMMSDTITYVMAQHGYKIFPYIDDYTVVTHKDRADDALQYLAHLLTELDLQTNPDKLSTSLTCLGITINLECHTVSIEYYKIRAIWHGCG